MDTKDRLGILKDIFSNINSWLHYGERKNAVLLTANSGALYFFLKLVANTNSIFVYSLAVFNISLLLIAITVSLSSFIPILSIEWLEEQTIFKKIITQKEDNKHNPLFFEHITGMDSVNYLESIFPDVNSDGFSDLEKYYAGQIIANSQIASKKFRKFEEAVFMSMIVLVLPVLIFLSSVIRDKYKKN